MVLALFKIFMFLIKPARKTSVSRIPFSLFPIPWEMWSLAVYTLSYARDHTSKGAHRKIRSMMISLRGLWTMPARTQRTLRPERV
jgi:hypothetical protein